MTRYANRWICESTLAPLLQVHWGLRQVQIEPECAGHVNSSFRVSCREGRFVLRASWPAKSRAQLRREQMVLRALGGTQARTEVPRLRSTVHGHPGMRAEQGSWLHLFEWIDGRAGLPAEALGGTRAAMRALAGLHAALAPLPVRCASPVRWLLERYRRVGRRAPPPVPAEVRAEYAPILARIGRLLKDVTGRVPGAASWLHGDFHPGNVLFDGAEVRGIIDFDDVGAGAPLLETAFALFTFSRCTTAEEQFEFDAWRWEQGLRAYAEAAPAAATGWLRARRDAMVSLFCVDQVLMHLEAAQRGLWTLTPGVGFLGCWSELRRASQSAWGV